AINNLGVLFSTRPYCVVYDDTFLNICVLNDDAPLTNFAHVYSTQIIDDTVKWKTIEGSFIADSAYEYIIVGNVYDFAHTSYRAFRIDPNHFPYYYVDDVCVSEDSFTCVNIKNQFIDFLADSVNIKVGECIDFSFLSSINNYDAYEWHFPGANPDTSTQ